MEPKYVVHAMLQGIALAISSVKVICDLSGSNDFGWLFKEYQAFGGSVAGNIFMFLALVSLAVIFFPKKEDPDLFDL